MQLAIDTADPRPIDTQIVDEVRRALVLGTLRPDDDLPPVRILAAELRVNPSAVASAYRTLEAAGVVQMRWGRGPVVSYAAPAPDDRQAIVRRVADRALRDARRNGVTAAELLDALQASVAEPNPNREPSR
ncbi:MAG TPA: GntR family transcriptional regulator [Longimicrobium sp.]|nr:GntR family transcriptional regulator [Longimicrobium sp.]